MALGHIRHQLLYYIQGFKPFFIRSRRCAMET
jgi:hypothetical protein